MGDLVPRSQLSNQVMKGIGGIGGGILLMALSGVISGPVGWIAAGVLGVIGLGLTLSKKEKKAGMATLGVAAVTALAGIFFPGLIWVAGAGLIIFGGFSIYKFIKNMQKRM